MTVAIELRHVHKRFGERRILEDASLRIECGERVALLGESGSGKSTLLNLIAGLETPDDGSVHILDEEMSALDADARARLRRERIGFVFQSFHLLPFLDAVRNVAVPLLLGGMRSRAALAQAAHELDSVGLGARLHDRPQQLSGGEQQRVALARALVHRPAIVLADEPTGNLDPDSAHRALEQMVTAIAEREATLLLVTHSEAAAVIAGRRLRLQGHRITAETDSALPTAAP
jgi:putative ABC transport system ATP-binding protein